MVYMRRYGFYLNENVVAELKKIPGTMSENVRKALNEYVKKYYSVSSSVSSSMEDMSFAWKAGDKDE